jgi:hypothetical protein
VQKHQPAFASFGGVKTFLEEAQLLLTAYEGRARLRQPR